MEKKLLLLLLIICFEKLLRFNLEIKNKKGIL